MDNRPPPAAAAAAVAAAGISSSGSPTGVIFMRHSAVVADRPDSAGCRLGLVADDFDVNDALVSSGGAECVHSRDEDLKRSFFSSKFNSAGKAAKDDDVVACLVNSDSDKSDDDEANKSRHHSSVSPMLSTATSSSSPPRAVDATAAARAALAPAPPGSMPWIPTWPPAMRIPGFRTMAVAPAMIAASRLVEPPEVPSLQTQGAGVSTAGSASSTHGVTRRPTDIPIADDSAWTLMEPITNLMASPTASVVAAPDLTICLHVHTLRGKETLLVEMQKDETVGDRPQARTFGTDMHRFPLASFEV